MIRMAAQKDAYIPASSGLVKECHCADRLTTLPYIVLGKLSVRPKRCNFVVVHDFFDTLDATSLMLKQVTQRHDGCQALCFNYPGQAFTKWPVLSSTEKDRGGIEPLHNCDWLGESRDIVYEPLNCYHIYLLLHFVSAISTVSHINPITSTISHTYPPSFIPSPPPSTTIQLIVSTSYYNTLTVKEKCSSAVLFIW